MFLESHFGLFPGEVGVVSAKVAVFRRLLVDRAFKVQLFDNVTGAEVEIRRNDLLDLLVGAVNRRSVGIDVDRQRVRKADSVRNLHKHAVGELVRHDRFGDEAGVVSSGAIDLGWVLAGEGTTSVGAPSTIGIHNNLAASKTGISSGAALNEGTRGVDDNLGVLQEISGNNLSDDLLFKNLTNSLDVDAGFVLSRDQNVVGADNFQRAIGVLLVLKNDLRFAVGAEPWDLSIVALISHLLANLVGEPVRVGVQVFLVPLISGVSKHEALVTSTKVALVLTHMNTISDFFCLSLDVADNIALAAIKADVVVCVANLLGDITGHLLEVDLLCCDSGLTEEHNLFEKNQ